MTAVTRGRFADGQLVWFYKPGRGVDPKKIRVPCHKCGKKSAGAWCAHCGKRMLALVPQGEGPEFVTL